MTGSRSEQIEPFANDEAAVGFTDYHKRMILESVQISEILHGPVTSIDKLSIEVLNERLKRQFENAELYLQELIRFLDDENRRPYNYDSNLFRWLSCELMSTIVLNPAKARELLSSLPANYQAFLLWGEIRESAYQEKGSLNDLWLFQFSDSYFEKMTSEEFNGSNDILWNGGNYIIVDRHRHEMPWSEYTYIDYLKFLAPEKSCPNDRVDVLKRLHCEAKSIYQD
jgi:hypothetical protein